MKNDSLTFQNRVYLFHGLFYASMFFSKTIHPIYFESEGRLTIFGLSYMAMAVAGAFSPFYGKYILSIGIHRSAWIGCLLYMVGLGTRIYTDPKSLVIFSGFISGMGASLLMLLSRYWIYEFETSTRNRHITHIEIISNLSQGVGIFLSGYCALFFSMFMTEGTRLSLLVPPGILFLTLLFLPASQAKPEQIKNDNASILSTIAAFPKITLVFTSLTILQGLYVGIFAPFIPVLMTHYDIKINLVGTIIAVGTVLGGFAQLGLKKHLHSTKHVDRFFLFTAAIIASCVFLMLHRLPIFLIVIIFCGYSIARVMNKLFSDFIKVEIVPRSHAPIIFGLFSTGFLTGDMLGGCLGARLFSTENMDLAAVVLPLLIVASSISIYIFSRSQKTATMLPNTMCEAIK